MPVFLMPFNLRISIENQGSIIKLDCCTLGWDSCSYPQSTVQNLTMGIVRKEVATSRAALKDQIAFMDTACNHQSSSLIPSFEVNSHYLPCDSIFSLKPLAASLNQQCIVICELHHSSNTKNHAKCQRLHDNPHLFRHQILPPPLLPLQLMPHPHYLLYNLFDVFFFHCVSLLLMQLELYLLHQIGS